MVADRSYVITGGAGFIGSHFTEYLLERGHSVTAIDAYPLVGSRTSRTCWRARTINWRGLM